MDRQPKNRIIINYDSRGRKQFLTNKGFLTEKGLEHFNEVPNTYTKDLARASYDQVKKQKGIICNTDRLAMETVKIDKK